MRADVEPPVNSIACGRVYRCKDFVNHHGIDVEPKWCVPRRSWCCGRTLPVVRKSVPGRKSVEQTKQGMNVDEVKKMAE